MTAKQIPSPVPNMEHSELNFNWTDVQLFRLIAQCGSFRGASRKSNRSVNSLRRRLRYLEHQMNCRLLVRDVSGAHLTEHGERLLAAGNDMFEASLKVSHELIKAEREQSNRVSIHVDEALGNFWLIPQSVNFQRSNPGFRLDFRCAVQCSDQFHTRCDIAVQTSLPNQDNLIATRLGYLHAQPFATREFVERWGMPYTREDLDRFSLVELDKPQDNEVNWATLVPELSCRNIVVTTNTRATHLAAVCHGAGIGLLPTYFNSVERDLVPLLDDLRYRSDIYLTYQRDAGNHKQVRTVIDWLKSAFNARQHPWFSEKHTPPDAVAI